MALPLDSLRHQEPERPPIWLLYGVNGVGKTTLAVGAPAPVLLAVEQGIGRLEVPHSPITSWAEVLDALSVLAEQHHTSGPS